MPVNATYSLKENCLKDINACKCCIQSETVCIRQCACIIQTCFLAEKQDD